MALQCGDMGRYAQAENLLSQSARFLLKADDARTIVDGMEATVRGQWHEIRRREGVSDKDCETIQSRTSTLLLNLSP